MVGSVFCCDQGHFRDFNDENSNGRKPKIAFEGLIGIKKDRTK